MATYSEVKPDLSERAQVLMNEAQMLARGGAVITSAHVLIAALDYHLSIPDDRLADYPYVSRLYQGGNDTVERLRSRMSATLSVTGNELPDILAPDLDMALRQTIHSGGGVSATAASIIAAVLSTSSQVVHDFNLWIEANNIDSKGLVDELKRESEHQAFSTSAVIPAHIRRVPPTKGNAYAKRHQQTMGKLIVALKHVLENPGSGPILVWGMPGTDADVLPHMLADGIADRGSELARDLPALASVRDESITKIINYPPEYAVSYMQTAIESASRTSVVILRHLESLLPGMPGNTTLRGQLLMLLGKIEDGLVIVHCQTRTDADPRVAEVMGLEPAKTVHCEPYSKKHTLLTIRNHYLGEWESDGGVFFQEIQRPLGAQRTSSHKTADIDETDVQRMTPAFGLLYDLREGICRDGYHVACPYSLITVIQDCIERTALDAFARKSFAQTALDNASKVLDELPEGATGDQFKAHLTTAKALIEEAINDGGALGHETKQRAILRARDLIVELFSGAGSTAFRLPQKI